MQSNQTTQGERFAKQDKVILDYLLTGNSLTRLDAWKMFQSSALNSRVSTLRNKHHIPISDTWVTVTDGVNEPVKVKSYYIEPQNIQTLKNVA